MPPSEFDPRAAVRRFDDSLSDAAITTAAKVKDRIAGLILDIESLKLVDGITHELQSAKAYTLIALNYVEEHEKSAVAAIKAEVEHLR